ncbi:MAG TPA: hypothetical protein VIR54_16305 [Vicinamibacterales bacterium]|jgi:hypothetical protein
MTTATSSTRIRHDSDATFREWGLEFSTKLAACGLVQTSDTGQINWVTVTRPGVSTNAGFEIWRFNDTQQGTSPIFLRFDYGTGGGATIPRIQMTVGSGTNGSGTITATGSFTITSINNASIETSDTLRNSYWCHVDGAFTWCHKVGSTAVTIGMVGRTVDSAMAADSAGAMVVFLATNVVTGACMNFVGTDTITTKRLSAAANQLCHWPQSPAASLVGSDQQAATVYGTFPRMRPIPWMVGVIDSEFPTGNTFSDTPVGSTPHTYLAGPNIASMDAASVLKPAIIFE